MNINQMLQGMMQYFTEAFTRIFGPSTDEYPEVGVQPFEGEPNTVKPDDVQAVQVVINLQTLESF